MFQGVDIMSTSIILQQMGVIVILVSIGIYLYKKGTVDSTVSPRLSSIVVDVCNPALILASILSGNITATHKDLLIGIFIGVIFYAFLRAFFVRHLMTDAIII